MATKETHENSSVEKPEIKAVAFDLDGLMFNTEDLYDEVIDAILIQRGHRFSSELKLEMMGLPGVKAVDVMIQAHSLTESPQELLDEAHHRMSELMPGRIQPMPGLLELLALMEEVELPKSIATSSSPEFAASALKICDLSERFLFVLTAEDVENGKPHPDIYLESARRHSVPVQNMLVLDDSLIGSRAAAASGAVSVAVPGHHSAAQDFSHVNFRVDSLADEMLRAMVSRRQV